MGYAANKIHFKDEPEQYAMSLIALDAFSPRTFDVQVEGGQKRSHNSTGSLANSFGFGLIPEFFKFFEVIYFFNWVNLSKTVTEPSC